MMNFTLTCRFGDEYEGDGVTRTEVAFEADSLDRVLEGVENFLRGCGFVFDGVLDVFDDYEQDEGISRAGLVEIGLEEWHRRRGDRREEDDDSDPFPIDEETLPGMPPDLPETGEEL